MIIDPSALAAVCFGEDDAERYVEALESSDSLAMSSVSFVEAGIVIDARNPGALDRLLDVLGVEVAACDQEQAELARAAYRRYGRGSGHAAALNFGDCFSYALATLRDEALLFKGNDFALTDVRPALED